MKLLSKILIFSFLLIVSSSTSSNNVKSDEPNKETDSPLFFPVLKTHPEKEERELEQVKSLLSDTQEELTELKLLLELKKERDSLLIQKYVVK